MIVEQKSVKVETTGIERSGFFGVAEENLPWLFNILRNNLYSDKILAVLREYCSNALDAHVEAGCPERPITITLPTKFNTQLSIRDYGLGLSEENIYKVFASYGKSTKRSSDDLIGGFGIGCKSAFCYVPTFNITSYHNGVRTLYTAYIDETNVGKIDKLLTEPTEETGIEISLNVASADLTRFQSTLCDLLRHYEVLPEVVNFEQYYTNTLNMNRAQNETFIKDSKGEWELVKDKYKSSCLIVGNVSYPINWKVLNLPHELESFLYSSLILKLPLSFVKISANREALDYDSTTIKNLTDKLNEVYKSIEVEVQKKLDLQNSLFEAYYIYANLPFSIKKLNLKYQGYTLQNFLSSGSQNLPSNIYNIKTRKSVFKYFANWKGSGQQHRLRLTWSTNYGFCLDQLFSTCNHAKPDDMVILWGNGELTSSKVKAIITLPEFKDKSLVFVSYNLPGLDLKEYFSKFEYTKDILVMKWADIKIPEQRKSRVVVKGATYRLLKTKYYGSGVQACWESPKLIESASMTGKTYYVVLKNYRTDLFSVSEDFELTNGICLQAIRTELERLFNSDHNIVGIADSKFALPEWVSLSDYLIKLKGDTATCTKLQNILIRERFNMHKSSRNVDVLFTMINSKSNSTIEQYRQLVASFESKLKSSLHGWSHTHLSNLLGIKIPDEDLKDLEFLNELSQKISKDYPIFSALVDKYKIRGLSSFPADVKKDLYFYLEAKAKCLEKENEKTST